MPNTSGQDCFSKFQSRKTSFRETWMTFFVLLHLLRIRGHAGREDPQAHFCCRPLCIFFLWRVSPLSDLQILPQPSWSQRYTCVPAAATGWTEWTTAEGFCFEFTNCGTVCGPWSSRSLVLDFFRTWCHIFSVYQIRQKTNVYDYLLISLLLYDEVSAFLLLVKARNSSF